MPSFWYDWADEWLMIIEVKKTIPKTAKMMLIAFFINSIFNVFNEFSQHYKVQNLDYNLCYIILENNYIIHTFYPGIVLQ